MSRSFDVLSDACLGVPHTVRKMFGGHGFFAPNGGMFAAIVTDDEVIVKLADDVARAALLAIGGHAWTYGGKGKPVTMGQWIVVPESFYDDHEQLQRWVTRAHALVPAKVKAARGPPKPSSRRSSKVKQAATLRVQRPR
jgi:TfoX/Sxy family transcriptional regulator of competence genes